MILPAFWNQAWTAALANHLWQSTVVTLVAWFLSLTLRSNQARTRYWVWMIASAKFLIPFSLLIAAGESLRSAVATPIRTPALAAVMEQITQPFPQTTSAAAVPYVKATPVIAAHHSDLLPLFLAVVWLCGSFAIAFSWARKWWRIRAAIRAASQMTLLAEVPVLSSPHLLEPGIFGIIRPVLLLPDNISDRLSAPQLNTIIAHEMCHVQRRDNLTAAIHMVVEVAFWFHPAVWWIKSRLLEERERACDEAVLQSGNEAQLYAESILNVCKFYVESPLACVSGVTGSDLKRRIVRIMTEQVARKLSLARKLLLAALGVGAIAGPILVGLVKAPLVSAQSPQASLLPQPGAAAPQTANPSTHPPAYDVASIKPAKPRDGSTLLVRLDGFTVKGMPLKSLIKQAYGIEDDQIAGAPKWVNSETYDIEAKVDGADAAELEKLSEDQFKLMFQSFLIDRFKLKVHWETKELPVLALVVAKGGPKLQEAKPGDTYANGIKGPDGKPGGHAGMMMRGRGRLTGQGIPIASMVPPLTQELGRIVQDKTGLTGKYDIQLRWTTDDAAPDSRSASDPSAPSIFTAIQEQLGLKLESRKAPVEVLMIDHVDQPSPN